MTGVIPLCESVYVISLPLLSKKVLSWLQIQQASFFFASIAVSKFTSSWTES